MKKLESGLINPSITASLETQELDMSRLVYMLYQDLELQIARADTKAQLALSTNTILAAVVASFGIQADLANNPNTGKMITIFCYAGFFLCVLLSVAYALLASFPQRAKVILPNEPINYYNPNFIANTPKGDYIEGFLKLNVQDFKLSILSQIHAKAAIAQLKFLRMQTSLRFILAGIVLLTIAQGLQLLVV